MKKHSIEAQRLLDELDAELAANGAAAGRSLGWSASERQIISMAADAIDRGVELAAAYARSRRRQGQDQGVEGDPAAGDGHDALALEGVDRLPAP